MMEAFGFLDGFTFGLTVGLLILWVVMKIVGSQLKKILSEIEAAIKEMEND